MVSCLYELYVPNHQPLNGVFLKYCLLIIFAYKPLKPMICWVL